MRNHYPLDSLHLNSYVVVLLLYNFFISNRFLFVYTLCIVFMTIYIMLLALFAELALQKALLVDNANSLASLTLGGFDEVHFWANITLGLEWKPVNFSGAIYGYGHTIVLMSSVSVFDTLSNTIMTNLPITRNSALSGIGTLTTETTVVSMIFCIIKLTIASDDSTLQSISGLFQVGDSLSLTGCVINVSMDLRSSISSMSVVGLAASCRVLTVTNCAINVTIIILGARNVTAGGLVATAAGLTTSQCTVTFLSRYTGSGEYTTGGLAAIVTSATSRITEVTVRVHACSVRSSRNVIFGGVIGITNYNVFAIDTAIFLGPLTISASAYTVGGVVAVSFSTMSLFAGINANRTSIFTDNIVLASSSDASVYGGWLGRQLERAISISVASRGD